jgi:hypothetical protein
MKNLGFTIIVIINKPMHKVMNPYPSTNFNILLIRDFIFRPPNGPALSCGADNFQVADNETSSC